ncbi:MAG TPA: hypothetical protein VMB80_13835 [Candidatus Acidoferrum sp.]|nr:hypothetical protein [Candidatus Acidoferrum sp.]
MAIQLTAEDARQSLNAHVAARGAELRAKYGPRIGWLELQQLLTDRSQVRYPCEVVFHAGPLQPGEFAHPVARGERPEDGFVMHVHPVFLTQLSQVPALVLYQLVLVNYGEFASADDAETFGAAALGISRDEYYQTLCALAGQVGEPELCH